MPKPTRVKKARKPRGTKQDGTPSQDLCPCCLKFQCDPFGSSPAFRDKVNRRKAAGCCPACGGDPCICKSSLQIGGNGHATHQR